MKIPVSSLHHHPLNEQLYNLSDIDTLTNSIKEVGLLEPLVVNKKNEVISGNRRLEALRKLRYKENFSIHYPSGIQEYLYRESQRFHRRDRGLIAN